MSTLPARNRREFLRGLFVLGTAGVVAALAGACGAPGATPARRPVTTTPASATGVALAPGTAVVSTSTSATTARTTTTTPGGPITIIDQRGKTITLARPATRAIAIVIPAASLLMAVDGSAARVVGVNPSSAQAIQGEILGEIFPTARAIASNVSDAAFAPNVEAILALKPDVVIQWGDRGPDIIAPIENVGVPVVGLKYGTQEDLETWIALFGTLIGKPDRAAQLIAWQHQQLADLRAQLPVPGTPQKVLYFNRARPDLSVAGANTYNDYYIRLVGGENAARVTNIVSTNAEQILAWNPDVMLVGNFDAATPADIYANPLWANVGAIKGRRVYKVPLGGYRWDPPNQESPLMWHWLAQLLYPDVVKGDLRAMIRQSYQLLYSTEPADAQLDRILQLRANEGAARYDRFARS